MKIAVVGCGYVADSYGKTLKSYSELQLIGAYDNNKENLESFCSRWPAKKYTSLDQVLDDPSVEMVLNLTNPRSHYEITRKCIAAGKHVYSEKPLAMDAATAAALVELAKQKNVYLGTAPCSVLGETAQTIWKALRQGVIGRVRLVYANFDDGMIAPTASPWLWRNEAGVSWPAKDEFEVGCTFEHAGYILTWLAAFFGPAMAATAFSSCQIPDKGIPVDRMAPDFSVGCIEYSENIVARVTCSIVGPKDKSLSIIGDDGVIFTSDVRNDSNPVYVRQIPAKRWEGAIERRLDPLRSWLESCLHAIPWTGRQWRIQRRYPFARKPSSRFVSKSKRVDFCRGPAEMAEAIRQKRQCRLSAELGLHITELIDALQNPRKFGRQKIESRFAPIEPLSWSSHN